MRDLLIENEVNEEMEAKMIMAEEWNRFQIPQEIDDLITDLFYWKDQDEHLVVLAIMEEFDAIECYARKCLWFSTANFHLRKQEEARGAFYQSAFCKDSCVPKRFRRSDI